MAVWTSPPSKELADAGRWDAEAYTPFLRSLDATFRKSPRLLSLATVTHAAEITRSYTESSDSKLFLLAQNIRPLLPSTSTEFRIPAQVAAKIPTNRLQHADVLVTRSGANSGMCAVYLGADGDCYTSGEGLIVRSLGSVDGTYLAVFLNTVAGQALCRRAIYGSGQPHIGPKYLEQAHVPRLGPVEERAGELVRAAYSELSGAERLYPEAETELLERIGWEELKQIRVELSYVNRFSVLSTAARADAEYFQPQYARLRARIAERGSLQLGAFCPRPTRGVQPELVDGGEVLAIDSKAVRAIGVDPANTERTSRAFHDQQVNARGRVNYRDVLLNSTGRGTLGRATCYRLKQPAICDNHVAILRPDGEVCDPVYLSLFLNSPAGLAQSEQFQTGSSGQLEIYPEHIQQFLVYLPRDTDGVVDLAWQHHLAAKVESAALVKSSAQAKLDEAKRLVEDALMNRV